MSKKGGKRLDNSDESGIIEAGTNGAADSFDRKARLYSNDEDLHLTNPNYSTNKYEWTHNCQRCVSTYEMRRRGYNVTAKPLPTSAKNKWRLLDELS
ncbi:MAG: hypothetical protein LUF33_00180 [Clostridiales bacterium]|nr:hypothetical protein [Clostridiales bacterium]